MNMPGEIDALVRSNLQRVRERIATACDSAARSVDEVRLVGVSKYVGPRETAALFAAGCTLLGEARPQELWAKAEAPELASLDIEWRLIGHLQRNKVGRTLPLVASIDSVDSRRLLSTIDHVATDLGHNQRVLLEVNISGDSEKHGFSAQELREVVKQLDAWPHVEVKGLMGMAAREGGVSVARGNFAALRELREELATPSLPLAELSIGMSSDFEAAIAEGSTLVRIGSALWEGLK
jgi:pyridoxal phosphate enzyme (YggS family)